MRNVRYSDFHHISVPGDGTCFFHSIVTILALEKETLKSPKFQSKLKKESRKLRLATVRWLRKNLDYRIKNLGVTIEDEINEAVNSDGDENYSNIDEYLEYMKTDDGYAGQIEMYAVSNILKRNIKTYFKKGNKFSSLGLGFNYTDDKTSLMDDIFIFHNIGKTKKKGLHHFEALYPKEKLKLPLSNKKKTKKTNSVERKRKTNRVDRKTNRVERKRTNGVERRRKTNRVERKRTNRVDRRRKTNRVDRRRINRINRIIGGDNETVQPPQLEITNGQKYTATNIDNEELIVEIEELNAEIERVESDFEEALLENERVESENVGLQFQNEGLQFQNEGLLAQNEEVSTQIESLKMDNQTLKMDNQTLKRENEDLKNNKSSESLTDKYRESFLIEQNERLRRKIGDLQKELDGKKVSRAVANLG